MSHEIALYESIMRDPSKVAFSCPAQSEIAVANDAQQASFHDTTCASITIHSIKIHVHIIRE